jgi:2-C-methyl-D-erythritol 2,4-cyclodiphosphate synthase
MNMRIGIGYDVHRLVDGRKLIMGGVEVPHEAGLLGHSDADVLVHAIMDAILGALSLGDIGKHFPDSDNAYRGISSLELLKKVAALADGKGYRVSNIDSIIVAQRPRMAPHIDEMRINISMALGIEMNAVSVKATTTEKLGFEGREEGISSQAVCLLEKI